MRGGAPSHRRHGYRQNPSTAFIAHRSPDWNKRLRTLIMIVSLQPQEFSSGYLYFLKLTCIALNKKGYVSCLNLDLGWLFNNAVYALSKTWFFNSLYTRVCGWLRPAAFRSLRGFPFATDSANTAGADLQKRPANLHPFSLKSKRVTHTPVRYYFLFTEEDTGFERSSDLPKASELVSGREGPRARSADC